MRLETADVDRYGPLFDCRPPCNDGLTVISGPNEAGKTLYLEAVLQLLEPDVTGLLDPDPRVDGDPVGRVVIEHGGERHEFPGETALSEIAGIEPDHLRSIFVVRDSDLQLPGEQDYYTSLIEKLGDIHTTEIATIKSALKERGRLTEERLDVSSDQQYHNAGNVRNAAEELAEEIREYVDTTEDKGLDELDARRLRTKRRLEQLRADLERQREAKTVDAYEHLSEQLETYRTTSQRLGALASFDRKTLEKLRKLRAENERDDQALEELEDEIAEAKAEIEQTSDALDDLQERRAELERKVTAAESAEAALDAYRRRQDSATGADEVLALTRPVTVVGLLGAAVAAAAGALQGSTLAIGVGVLLFLVGLVSGHVYYRVANQGSDLEATRREALREARDAGLDVGSVDEIAPAIESVEQRYQTINNRVIETKSDLTTIEDRLSELQEEQASLETELAEREQTLSARLDAAEVRSIEAFSKRVEQREEMETDQGLAQQSLVDRFDEPAADAPENKAVEWRQALEELVAGVDLDAVDADDYDQRELERLESEVGDLERELEALETQLDAHDDRLDGFDNRARDLNTRPFVGEPATLEARTKAGLEQLAGELDQVVEEIERDAELSRKAIELFDRIEAAEEQKLKDLFDPEGPASRTFAQVTDGRYTEVAYDADGHDLVVHGRDGGTYRPRVLSQGTRDQLYFATRVSLAQQLLGPDPGFLLLDDPFLAADPDRLRQGFHTLRELASDGWQIIYLTAKREVSERMVDEFDLEHVELGTRTVASSRTEYR